MLSLTDAQLEFILMCYSEDNPNELRFVPARLLAEQIAEQTANVGWANVLIGKARQQFMSAKQFLLPERFRGASLKRFPAAPPPPPRPPERPSTRIKR